jgi:short-subunit dehydrogenase
MSDLRGKTAIVTGAGRGLGRATATQLGKAGVRVAIVARSADEIAQTAADIAAAGGEAIAVCADVTDPNQVEQLFDRVAHEYGPTNVLVNNAGIGLFGAVEALSPRDLDSILEVNLKATVYCSQQAFRHMRQNGSGHIINVVSTSGRVGRARESGYAASKWAVAGFTESIRAEGKPLGIRVTSFCPGGMNTSFWNTASGQALQPDSASFMSADQVARLLLEIIRVPETMVVDEIVIRRFG